MPVTYARTTLAVRDLKEGVPAVADKPFYENNCTFLYGGLHCFQLQKCQLYTWKICVSFFVFSPENKSIRKPKKTHWTNSINYPVRASGVFEESSHI